MQERQKPLGIEKIMSMMMCSKNILFLIKNAKQEGQPSTREYAS